MTNETASAERGEPQGHKSMTETPLPDAYLFSNEWGEKELLLSCHGEQAQRLLEHGWTCSELFTRTPSHHDLVEALRDVGASLAAAISLLERGGKAAKKAAPSDRMFDQMVKDYKASLERTRATLTKAEARS